MAGKLLRSEEGEILAGIGGSVRYLLEKSESGGVLGAWVQTVPGRSGPPVHYHTDADEAAFMLSGEFLWTLDGKQTLLGPGGFLFVPKNTVHGFVNATDQEGSFICWVTPAGFEGYYRERIHIDPARDPEALVQIAARFDMIVA